MANEAIKTMTIKESPQTQFISSKSKLNQQKASQK